MRPYNPFNLINTTQNINQQILRQQSQQQHQQIEQNDANQQMILQKQQKEELQRIIERLEKILDEYKKYKQKQPKKQKIDQNEKFVILLGKTGVGKSTLFNFLIGAPLQNIDEYGEIVIQLTNPDDPSYAAISSDFASETMDPFYSSIEIEQGEKVTIVDLPGFFGTSNKDKDFEDHEQQWLDSMKYYHVLKKCTNAIFLLILTQDQIIKRDQAINLEQLLTQLKCLSGIYNTELMAKMTRIILNKTKNNDNSIEQLTKLIEKNMQSIDQKWQDNLTQLLQILKQGIVRIKQPQTEDEQILTDQKREEVFKLITSTPIHKITSFLSFQNYQLLNSTLERIREQYYIIELRKFITFIIKSSEHIKNYIKDINFPQNSFQSFILQETQQFQIFQMNQQNDLFFTSIKLIVNSMENIQEMGQNWQIKDLKKIPEEMEKLIKLIFKYNPEFQFNLDEFKRYYRLLYKLGTPEQTFDNNELIQYKRKQLNIELINSAISDSLQIIKVFNDKLELTAEGLGLQIQVEYRKINPICLKLNKIITLLIQIMSSYYGECLIQLKQHEDRILKWSQLQEQDQTYRNEEMYKSSLHYQQLLDEKENYRVFETKKRRLLEDLFLSREPIHNCHAFDNLIEKQQKQLKDAQERFIQMFKEYQQYSNNSQNLEELRKKSMDTISYVIGLLENLKIIYPWDSYILDMLNIIDNYCFIGGWEKFREFFVRTKKHVEDYNSTLLKFRYTKDKIDQEIKKHKNFKFQEIKIYSLDQNQIIRNQD